MVNHPWLQKKHRLSRQCFAGDRPTAWATEWNRWPWTAGATRATAGIWTLVNEWCSTTPAMILHHRHHWAFMNYSQESWLAMNLLIDVFRNNIRSTVQHESLALMNQSGWSLWVLDQAHGHVGYSQAAVVRGFRTCGLARPTSASAWCNRLPVTSL